MERRARCRRAPLVCAIVSVLGMHVGPAGAGNLSEYRAATATKTPGGHEYAANSGRPVFEIVQLLGDRTGHVVNYEDAPFWYAGELDDVTAEMGSNPAASRLRGGRPLTLPKNRAFVWQDRLPERAPSIDRVQGALESLVAVQNARADGGKFAVVRDGNVLHVVPTRTRGRDGRWRDVAPLLDVRITVPAEPRTVREQVRAILDAARDASRVTYVGVPFPPPADRRAPPKSYAVENVTARQALLDVLRDASWPTRWAVLYDPLTEGYSVSFFGASPPRADGAVAPVAPVTPSPATPSSGTR